MARKSGAAKRAARKAKDGAVNDREAEQPAAETGGQESARNGTQAVLDGPNDPAMGGDIQSTAVEALKPGSLEAGKKLASGADRAQPILPNEQHQQISWEQARCQLANGITDLSMLMHEYRSAHSISPALWETFETCLHWLDKAWEYVG